MKNKQSRDVTWEYFLEIIKDTPTHKLFSVEQDGRRIWTQKRVEIHQRIIQWILETAVESKEPFAVFMGGGSASGKSRILKEIVIPWLNSPVIVIDSDIIKSRLPEYSVYAKVDSIKGASIVHQESKDVALIIFDKCLEKNYSLVYDSTMASPPGLFEGLIQKCREKKYRLIVVGVCTPIEVAIKREHERFLKTNRKVDEDTIRYTHEKFPKTFFALESQFDDLIIYDNSNEPLPVAERHGHDSQLEIYDSILYTGFKERGEAHEKDG